MDLVGIDVFGLRLFMQAKSLSHRAVLFHFEFIVNPCHRFACSRHFQRTFDLSPTNGTGELWRHFFWNEGYDCCYDRIRSDFRAFSLRAGCPSEDFKKAIASKPLCHTVVYHDHFCCDHFFNTKQLFLIPEPVLYMLKALSFIVVERLEFIFLSFWITKVISSSAIFIFFAAVGISHILKRQSHTRLAVVVSLIPYLTALWIDDPFIMDKMTYLVERISPFIFILIPGLLLVVSYFQNGKGRQKAA